MDKLTKKNAILATLGSLTLAGLVVIGIYNQPDDNPSKTVDAGVDAPPGILTTDLLSPPVPPHKIVIDGVNLPDNWIVDIKSFSLTGDAVGNFKILDMKQEGVRFLVMAENVSDGDLRLTATIRYSFQGK